MPGHSGFGRRQQPPFIWRSTSGYRLRFYVFTRHPLRSERHRACSMPSTRIWMAIGLTMAAAI